VTVSGDEMLTEARFQVREFLSKEICYPLWVIETQIADQEAVQWVQKLNQFLQTVDEWPAADDVSSLTAGRWFAQSLSGTLQDSQRYRDGFALWVRSVSTTPSPQVAHRVLGEHLPKDPALWTRDESERELLRWLVDGSDKGVGGGGTGARSGTRGTGRSESGAGGDDASTGTGEGTGASPGSNDKQAGGGADQGPANETQVDVMFGELELGSQVRLILRWLRRLTDKITSEQRTALQRELEDPSGR